jgi:hypothetical protein
MRCEQYINLSLSIVPRASDALSTLCSLRLSQNNVDDAYNIIQAVYNDIKEKRDVIRSRTVIDDLLSRDVECSQLKSDCSNDVTNDSTKMDTDGSPDILTNGMVLAYLQCLMISNYNIFFSIIM